MTETPRTWMWSNLLSPMECDKIIKDYYSPDNAQDAMTGTTQSALNPAYRKSKVCWINKMESVSLLMFSKALVANSKAGWNFDVDGHEPTQIAMYEDSGHYDWHTDEAFYRRNRGYHRKVSTVLFLSDPSTYTGGEFFYDTTDGEVKFEAHIGSLICFPSELRHRVTPVTSGVRYSLASWAIGPLMK